MAQARTITTKEGLTSSPTLPSPTSGTLAKVEQTHAAAEARDAALEFTEGGRKGWSADALMAWCHRRLLLRGALQLKDGLGGRFSLVEEGAGCVWLPTSPFAQVEPSQAAAVSRVGEVARKRVVKVLAGMLATPLDDRFVSGAIYAGRVRRVGRGDSAQWQPFLLEGEPLSQWVLALFAVDALTGREDYDQLLSVCEICGAVSFASDATPVTAHGRRRCPAHDGPLTPRPSLRAKKG